MLKKLLSKKNLVILGINSGTSADGVDLALIRFSAAGKDAKVSYLDGTMQPYSRKIKQALESAIRDGLRSVEEIGRLDMAYGHHLGQQAGRFIARSKQKVDLVASHGQTIGHYPKMKNILGVKTGATFQLGDGNAIAFETGLPVVSDFRRSDVAAGGEGAPLTPFVNQILFGSKKQSCIIVNIGGIANFSYHPVGRLTDAVRGGDCGPGNALSDMACQLLFHKRYDRNGGLAGKGRIIEEAIDIVRQINCSRGVSAGREQFNQYLLAKLIHIVWRHKGNNYDIMATIGDTTARLIYEKIRSYLADAELEAVYLTGGGRENLFIVRRLQAYLKPVPVRPVESLGYNGDLLEAVSFAVLGGYFVLGQSSNLPQITGASRPAIQGKLSLCGGK